MSRLDDRLTRELERAARPASPAGAFEHVDRRRARRARLRKVQSGALIVVVLAGTLAGIGVLRNAFREPEEGIGDTPSVGNGLIVYSEVRNAGQRLWAVRPDGTGAHQLTSGDGGSDTGPAISPDGRTIAFMRTDEIGSSVYTIGIDGADLTRLTQAQALDPTWSPDGSQIAFAGGAFGPYGIWIMNADGTDPRLIPGTDELDVAHPTWSPDGTMIAFGVGSTVPGVAEPINFDLFEASADGSGPLTNVTDTPGVAETAPAWSPDGNLIAFVRVPNTLDDTPAGGIAVIRPDGSGLRVLTEQHAFEQGPTWAPDGTMIAFQRDDREGTSIYTIRTDGTELTRVTVGSDPAWQPLIESSSAPSPTSNPSPGSGQDLGLGFPVCNVRSLEGDFDGNGTTDTAYVATKMSDAGGCPQADTTTNFLGVDLTGDGAIDAEAGPIGCELDCRPFMAIDLDRSGTDELLVQELGGAVLGVVPYQIISHFPDGPHIGPIEVDLEGGSAQRTLGGLRNGDVPSFYLGGDEGFAATLTCRSSMHPWPSLVYTTGQLDSIEQPTTWTILQDEFLFTDGVLWWQGGETHTQAVGASKPAELEIGSGLCGHPFPPNPAFET